MGGDFLFEFDGDDLCLYNPITGNIQCLSISIDYCFDYVESLFSLSRKIVHS